VDLFANIKFVSGQQANVIVNAFQSTTCTVVPPAAPEPIGFVIAPLSGTWSALSTTNIPLPSGTQSVQLQLDTSNSSASDSIDAYFDHILFGPTGTLSDVTPIPGMGVGAACALAFAIAVGAAFSRRRTANYSLKRTAADGSRRRNLSQ
jgi:hypothetical protein